MKICSLVAFIISFFCLVEFIQAAVVPPKRFGTEFKVPFDEEEVEDYEVQTRAPAAEIGERQGVKLPPSPQPSITEIFCLFPLRTPVMKTKTPSTYPAQHRIKNRITRGEMSQRRRRQSFPPPPFLQRNLQTHMKSSVGKQSFYHENTYQTTTEYPFLTMQGNRGTSTPSVLFPLTGRDFPTNGNWSEVPQRNHPKEDNLSSSFPSEFEGHDVCMFAEFNASDVVDHVTERNKPKFVVVYDELQTVTDPDQEEARPPRHSSFACETEVQVVRLGWVDDRHSGDRMPIVDTDLFPKNIRTERCLRASEPCSFVSPFHDSTCQQRYSLHRFIAVHLHDTTRSPVVFLFSFPAGCSCRVDPVRKHHAEQRIITA